MTRKRESDKKKNNLPYIELNSLVQYDIELLNKIIANSTNVNVINMPDETLSEMINIEDIKAIDFMSAATIAKSDKKYTEYQLSTLPQCTFSSHLRHLFEYM